MFSQQPKYRMAPVCGEMPGQHWPSSCIARHLSCAEQSPAVVGDREGALVGERVGALDGASVFWQHPKYRIAPVCGEIPGQHWPESCIARHFSCAAQSPAVVGDALGREVGDVEGELLGDRDGDADGRDVASLGDLLGEALGL